MTSKIKIFGQKLALWEGHFDHFGGQKSCFLDFLKVALEMLRSWLCIIIGFKRPTFMCIFSSKGRYPTSKIKNVCQNLALWEGHRHSRSALSFRAYAGPQRRGIVPVHFVQFELKIHIKVGILKPKTMPNQLLSISKTTFKKSKKRLFWPPKWSNHGYQFWQKCRFLGVFWT